MYRDDSDAANARVESLQAALRAGRAELAALDSRGGACRVSEHAVLVTRLRELAQQVDAQRARLGNRVNPHTKREEELTRLREQLGDLELLASGRDTMVEKLAACERAIEALAQHEANNASLAVATTPSDEDWVWVPRWGAVRRITRWLTTLGAISAGAAFAIAAGGGAIAIGGGLLALGGGLLGLRKIREDKLIAAQANAISVAGVRWTDVQRIRLERDPLRVILELPAGRSFIVRNTDVGYTRVLSYARSAVELYNVPVIGSFPKLLTGPT